MDEIRSLHQKLDNMTQTIQSLGEKVDSITVSQGIRDETMRKSANSINVIIRLLAVCIIKKHIKYFITFGKIEVSFTVNSVNHLQ